MRVGLTGGVASGKSTVSAMLAELGAVVVDADLLAREVVAPGTPGLAAVVADDPGGDPQPQPRSRRLGGVVRVEDVLQPLAGDPRPVVHDRHAVPRALGRGRPAGLQVLDHHRDVRQDPGLFTGIQRIVDGLFNRGQQGLAGVVEAQQVRGRDGPVVAHRDGDQRAAARRVWLSASGPRC